MPNYGQIVKELRRNQRLGKIQSYEARLKQLQALYKMLEENHGMIEGVLKKDLNKCQVEGDVMERTQILIECGNAIKNLKKWMNPTSVSPDLLNIPNKCEIYPDPYGVVLIMGAWNYPIQLTFLPLVGAIAAGNCVIIKPSEVSPHSAECVTKLVEKYMDQDVVRVINGGIPETTDLLKERFDIIMYTGSSFVGKIVMKAAAEHLTPVVLELGGKCPAFVDATCDFDIVAQRIVWAKFCNAGQTCLAVDYILCLDGCQDKIAAAVKKAIIHFYGEDQKKSESYGRIINSRHVQRLSKLIKESNVYYGNVKDEDNLYISPTIMTDMCGDDDIMKDEIFGPLLPMLPMASLDDAIDFVVDREKPLALYVFSNDKKTINRVRNETSSGGICINDALVHAGVPNLPFGGVGYSGMGSYHGKASFDTFSHKKSSLQKDQRLESLNGLRYPPYDPNWKPLIYLKSLMTPGSTPSRDFGGLVTWAVVAAVIGFIYQFVIKGYLK